MESVLPLLLESAKVGLAIRREYARVKSDPEARYFTYVLQLQDGKFYVGNTDNIYQRLMDHLHMTPSSAQWVRHHGPVERVVEVCRHSAKADELYKTLQYMDMFGWENVRGSSYCKIQMAAPPEPLKTFSRTRDSELHYLTRQEIAGIMQAIADLTNTT